MVIAVVVSLGLAALILTAGSPLVAAGVALAMLAFTAPDIREVAHQMHQARPGLAALAATVAVLHLLAAVGDLVVRFERDLALDGVLSRKTRQMVEKFVADLEARGPGYLADLARQAFIQYRGAT